MDMFDQVKKTLITCTVVGTIIGGFALVASSGHADACPPEKAAVGLCSNGTGTDNSTTSTTPTTIAGGTGSSTPSSTPAPTTTPSTVASAPSTTTPSTTIPVPNNTLSVDTVKSFCDPACDASRLEVLENGGAVHLKPGSTVLVNLAAGYCADTPSAREVGPSQFSAPEMTIRKCGGKSATSAPAASAAAPATPGAPCAIPGIGWMTFGGNSWVSDGSVVFNCVVPQGFLVDTPSGRKGPGTLLSTSQATAYQM